MSQKILIVAPEGRAEETVKRLARVGYDYSIGYLDGGFKTWLESGKEIDKIETVDAQGLANAHKADATINILDVRKPGEWNAHHIDGIDNFPLD